jgi:hypothetical protein|uniref:Uncharacterized protein n=1 Tax=viral metagenome TaxID=1070528 RepID=A0A6C0AGP0_9ZZZZ
MNFFNQSRIGVDEVSMTQMDIQDRAQNQYMLQPFDTDCAMRKTIEFATSQVNVNFCAAGGMGNQCGVGGCNIDENSHLLLGSLQTHPKSRISLFHRPFATVPYLGKGPFDPTAESQLQQTDSFSNNKKSVNTLSEISYIPMTNYPLIPSIQETVTNPAYLVEGVAMDGWVRGGASSRKQG